MALVHNNYYIIKSKGIEGHQIGQYDGTNESFRTPCGTRFMRDISSYSSKGFDAIDLLLSQEKEDDLERRVRLLERLLLLANSDRIKYQEAFRAYRNSHVMIDDPLVS
jgi:hypothetical protein